MVLNRLVSSSEGLKLECNFLIGQYCCRVVLALGNLEALGNVINNLVQHYRFNMSEKTKDIMK